MTETTRTNRFTLLFFLYFMGSSVALAMVPAIREMSDSAYMLLAQLISFLPPMAFYFFYTKKISVKPCVCVLSDGKTSCSSFPSAYPFSLS